MIVWIISRRLISISGKMIEFVAELSFDAAEIYDTMLGRCQASLREYEGTFTTKR